jgi:hypothetical protein
VNRNTLRQAWSRLASSAAVVLLGTAAAAADTQLVQLTNGRTIRAESVEPSDSWLMVTVAGGGIVGIPADAVDRIEDDLLPPSAELGNEVNVVTSGRYIPRSRGFGRSRASRRPSSRRSPRTPPQQNKQEEKAAPAARPSAGLVIQGKPKGGSRSPDNGSRRKQ